jgi:sialidase-1
MFGRIFGSGSLGSLLAVTTILFSSLALANVDDPAKYITPYHTKFPLFHSDNMNSPDKLSTGIGFHSFRIPDVVTTKTGRILAFAEGRRFNGNDWGDINLVYKRTKTTTSHGASASDWYSLQEVIGKEDGTWGNPTPVVDSDTIYLFMS